MKKQTSGGVYTLAVRILKVNVCLLMLFGLLYFVKNHYISGSDITSKTPTQKVYVKKREPAICHDQFKETMIENLRVVQNYPRGIADEYMWKIGGNMTAPNEILKFPVIVTAIHSLHYPESMGLFRSIHQYIMQNSRYRGFVKIIVYDIGLTKRQLKTLKKKCMCEVRSFPFEELPSHIRSVDNFAFKPIILQILLMEYGFVWWVDTSVRFSTDNLDSAIKFATENSILFYVKDDISKSHTVARQTDGQTLTFLKEDGCKFRNVSEAIGGFLLFHYDDVTRAVVSSWATCALNKQCIAPEGTHLKKDCYLVQVQDGRCHKFDQSVLSILMRRLHHGTNNYPPDNQLNDIYEIRKNEIDHYFESCRPILKCFA